MNILQASAPKSGSYWLFTIINQILEKANYPQKSFIQKQPIYEEAQHWNLSFQEQAGVDMLDIEEHGCFFRISSAFRHPVTNLKEYVNSCTQAWTHSTICDRSFNVFPLFSKVIYIVRDPRDRALSAARFALTPYMQKYYPTTYTSTYAYLDKKFEKLIEQWVWHVGNYLYYKDKLNIHFIFYEKLLTSFKEELQDLLDYLQIELTTAEKLAIEEEVTFSSMKQSNPNHVQKGKYGKWLHELSEDQKYKAVEIAGPLLQMLHYPTNEDTYNLTPCLPLNGYKKELSNIIKNMDWEPLFQ